MLLDIKRIFSQYHTPIRHALVFDLSGEDFPGYRVQNPTEVSLAVTLESDALRVAVDMNFTVLTECARCLDEIERPYTIRREYVVRDEEWLHNTTDLEFTPDAKLDVKELAITEILLEVPSVILCKDSCQGLCPVCGCRKPCACTCETNDVVDERLAILKQLLD